eukprot:TRINITY_DN11124_c1_g1_i1.p1 TRINITY_DN11124_c1_g1~~TRINITY_DN11124_c1_g1_i1.p1  ORF type:complete len:309 (-),score=30.13 TRINITY_DN11124_c1_g1_i1:218-1075(-)
MSAVAVELVAGGTAGAVGILATQPMDTVRIRLQSAKEMQVAKQYAGIMDCFKATCQREGIRGLYKGVASPTVTVGAMNALLFFSYESASNVLRKRSRLEDGQDLSISQVFAAGAASGFASAFITSPTELIKCIAQVDVKSEGKIREEWSILRNMIRRHGLWGAHGPCRGLLTTIVRETPSFGLYFASYEAATRAWGKSQAVSFVAGGCAGALAWSVIYPIDVVKTRWQTAAPGRYNSFWHCIQSTVGQEGYKALFRGYGATMARAWPQNGVIFCTYELVKGLMTK